MIADRKMKAAKAAFDTSIDCGITLFDTAEVYGSRVRNEFDICCFLYHSHNEKVTDRNRTCIHFFVDSAVIRCN